MKYFANLKKLSLELTKRSLNLEQYFYGVEPGRSVRWNEMVFLLKLCHNTICPPASDADVRILPRNSLPDTQRIREIERLIASILIDELSLDKPDTFGSICALRPPSQGLKPSSSSFRLDTFRSVSLILGRDPTRMEFKHLDPSIEPWKYVEMFDDNGSRRSRKLLELSSDFYLIYLALGELADLKYTIDIFRQQKLPEWTSLDSSDTSPTEEVTRQGLPPRPMSEDIVFFLNASINDPH